MVLMAATGLEAKFWAPTPPMNAHAWAMLLGGCVFVLIFNTSIAVGIALTTPLFISIGTELTIPATMAVDVLVTGEAKGWGEWLGAGLLMLSFTVLVGAGDAVGGGASAGADDEVMANPNRNSVGYAADRDDESTSQEQRLTRTSSTTQGR